MDFTKLKKEKGEVGGMGLLVSIVMGIFLVAMIVFALVISGAKMMEATDNAQADTVINDTINAVADVSDFFPVFVIIGSVVILIGMVVLIAFAVRGMSGGIGGTA